MLCVGDIYVYVSDFTLALRFWADGLGLEVHDKEISEHSAYARLDFPDGGPSLRLMGPVQAWGEDERPPLGEYPAIRFDVTTDDLDATLLRLLECGGQQMDEIETYKHMRIVTVSDPDGNVFELLEVVESQE